MCNTRVDVHYVEDDCFGATTKSFVFKNKDKVADYIRDHIGWSRVRRIEIHNTNDEQRKLLAVLS